MGFSGYAAQGAQQNLEQLFASQLKEELEREEMARLQEEREAQRAFREQDLDMRGEEMRQRTAIANREEARHEATAKATADKEAHKMTALRGISEFINTPGMENVAREHAVASGVDLPSYIEKKLDPKPLAKLVKITVPGPKGPRDIMVSEDDPRFKEGVDIYEKPPDRAPQYEQVIRKMPDGSEQLFDHVKGTAYQPGDRLVSGAGGKGGGTDAQDQREQRKSAARDTVGLLKALSGDIQTGSGIKQEITGAYRDFMGRRGYDPTAAVYNTLKGSAGATLAVAIMGAQNLSDPDRAIWDKMIPATGVDKKTKDALYAYLENYLAEKPPAELHNGSSKPPEDLLMGVLEVLTTGKPPPSQPGAAQPTGGTTKSGGGWTIRPKGQ